MPGDSASGNAVKIAQTLPFLPLAYTNFKGSYFPAHWKPADPIVLLIQDAHRNREAQANIGKAVDSIIESKNADVLALEGAFGPVDIKSIRDFENQSAVRKAADYFLCENKITGALHAALISPGPIPAVVGVDDERLYHAHVEAYRNSVSRQAEFKRGLAAAGKELSEKKAAAFNVNLLELDRDVLSYHENKLSLRDYVQRLEKYRQSLPREVDLYTKVLRMEKSINFEAVQSERTKLIRRLADQLSESATQKLLQASLAYRTGQLRHAEFYGLIRSLSRAHGLSLDEFPAMDAYIQYVLFSEKINAENFLNELTKLEGDTLARLAKTREEREIIAESRKHYLLSKLANFALTPAEWREYSSIKANKEARALRRAKLLEGIDLSAFESFFHHADSRDRAMAENLLKIVADRKPRIAVLVAGGFHAQGMEARFKQSGIAFVTLSPKISKIEADAGTEYLSVFTQEKSPLDKLFSGEKLFVSQLQWTATLKLQLVSYILSLSNLTKDQISATFRRLAGKEGLGFDAKSNGKKLVLNRSDGVEILIPVNADTTKEIQESIGLRRFSTFNHHFKKWMGRIAQTKINLDWKEVTVPNIFARTLVADGIGALQGGSVVRIPWISINAMSAPRQTPTKRVLQQYVVPANGLNDQTIEEMSELINTYRTLNPNLSDEEVIAMRSHLESKMLSSPVLVDYVFTLLQQLVGDKSLPYTEIPKPYRNRLIYLRERGKLKAIDILADIAAAVQFESDILQHSLKPTAMQSKVRDDFIEFANGPQFNNRMNRESVVFYDPETVGIFNPAVPYYLPFADKIALPRIRRSAYLIELDLLHAFAQKTGIGFPQRLLDDGMAEYVAILCDWSKRHGGNAPISSYRIDVVDEYMRSNSSPQYLQLAVIWHLANAIGSNKPIVDSFISGDDAPLREALGDEPWQELIQIADRYDDQQTGSEIDAYYHEMYEILSKVIRRRKEVEAGPLGDILTPIVEAMVENGLKAMNERQAAPIPVDASSLEPFNILRDYLSRFNFPAEKIKNVLEVAMGISTAQTAVGSLILTKPDLMDFVHVFWREIEKIQYGGSEHFYHKRTRWPAWLRKTFPAKKQSRPYFIIKTESELFHHPYRPLYKETRALIDLHNTVRDKHWDMTRFSVFLYKLDRICRELCASLSLYYPFRVPDYMDNFGIGITRNDWTVTLNLDHPVVADLMNREPDNVEKLLRSLLAHEFGHVAIENGFIRFVNDESPSYPKLLAESELATIRPLPEWGRADHITALEGGAADLLADKVTIAFVGAEDYGMYQLYALQNQNAFMMKIANVNSLDLAEREFFRGAHQKLLINIIQMTYALVLLDLPPQTQEVLDRKNIIRSGLQWKIEQAGIQPDELAALDAYFRQVWDRAVLKDGVLQPSEHTAPGTMVIGLPFLFGGLAAGLGDPLWFWPAVGMGMLALPVLWQMYLRALRSWAMATVAEDGAAGLNRMSVAGKGEGGSEAQSPLPTTLVELFSPNSFWRPGFMLEGKWSMDVPNPPPLYDPENYNPETIVMVLKAYLQKNSFSEDRLVQLLLAAEQTARSVDFYDQLSTMKIPEYMGGHFFNIRVDPTLRSLLINLDSEVIRNCMADDLSLERALNYVRGAVAHELGHVAYENGLIIFDSSIAARYESLSSQFTKRELLGGQIEILTDYFCRSVLGDSRYQDYLLINIAGLRDEFSLGRLRTPSSVNLFTYFLVLSEMLPKSIELGEDVQFFSAALREADMPAEGATGLKSYYSGIYKSARLITVEPILKLEASDPRSTDADPTADASDPASGARNITPGTWEGQPILSENDREQEPRKNQSLSPSVLETSEIILRLLENPDEEKRGFLRLRILDANLFIETRREFNFLAIVTGPNISEFMRRVKSMSLVVTKKAGDNEQILNDLLSSLERDDLAGFISALSQKDAPISLEIFSEDQKAMFGPQVNTVVWKAVAAEKFKGVETIYYSSQAPGYHRYIGVIAKMLLSHVFTIADHLLFSKREWQNRQEVVMHGGDRVWLTVPIYNKERAEPILDKRIYNDEKNVWQKKHYRSLVHAYGRLPYFKRYAGFFETLYDRRWESLSALNEAMTRYMAKELGAWDVEVMRSSDVEEKPAGHKATLIVSEMKKVFDGIIDKDNIRLVFLSGTGAAYMNDPSQDVNDGVTTEADVISREGIDIEIHSVDAQKMRETLGIDPYQSAAVMLFKYGPEAAEILRRETSLTGHSPYSDPASAPGAWAGVYELVRKGWNSLGGIPQTLKLPDVKSQPVFVFGLMAALEGAVTASLTLSNENWTWAVAAWAVINLTLHAFGVFSWNAQFKRWEMLTVRNVRGPPEVRRRFIISFTFANLLATSSLLVFIPIALGLPNWTAFITAIVPHLLTAISIGRPFTRSIIAKAVRPKSPDEREKPATTLIQVQTKPAQPALTPEDKTLVDRFIDEALLGRAPQEVAPQYRPGLIPIPREPQKGGNSSIPGKKRQAIDHLKHVAALHPGEFDEARILGALDYLAAHPKTPELMILEYEGIAHLIVKSLTTAEDSDPFSGYKSQLNQTLQGVSENVRAKLLSEADPNSRLRMSLIYSGIGNLLDLTYANNLAKIAAELGIEMPAKLNEGNANSQILEKIIESVYALITDPNQGHIILDQCDLFIKEISRRPQGGILYFHDNHGEVIFDQLVIEQLLERGHPVATVARGEYVRDDVTMDEALMLHQNNPYLRPYVDSGQLSVATDGSRYLGADLTRAGEYPQFIEAWKRSVAIIAKGAGNTQALLGQPLTLPMLVIRMIKGSSTGVAALRGAGYKVAASADELSPYDMAMAYQPVALSGRKNNPAGSNLQTQDSPGATAARLPFLFGELAEVDAPPEYLGGIGDHLGIKAGVQRLGITQSGISTRSLERIFRDHGIAAMNIADVAFVKHIERLQNQSKLPGLAAVLTEWESKKDSLDEELARREKEYFEWLQSEQDLYVDDDAQVVEDSEITEPKDENSDRDPLVHWWQNQPRGYSAVLLPFAVSSPRNWGERILNFMANPFTGAPLWETAVFHTELVPITLAFLGVDAAWISFIRTYWGTVGFAAAHVIVSWIARARNGGGWSSILAPRELAWDIIKLPFTYFLAYYFLTPQAHAVSPVAFLAPWLNSLPTPFIGFAQSAIYHFLFNVLIASLERAGMLPKGRLFANIFSNMEPNPREDEFNAIYGLTGDKWSDNIQGIQMFRTLWRDPGFRSRLNRTPPINSLSDLQLVQFESGIEDFLSFHDSELFSAHSQEIDLICKAFAELKDPRTVVPLIYLMLTHYNNDANPTASNALRSIMNPDMVTSLLVLHIADFPKATDGNILTALSCLKSDRIVDYLLEKLIDGKRFYDMDPTVYHAIELLAPERMEEIFVNVALSGESTYLQKIIAIEGLGRIKRSRRIIDALRSIMINEENIGLVLSALESLLKTGTPEDCAAIMIETIDKDNRLHRLNKKFIEALAHGKAEQISDALLHFLGLTLRMNPQQTSRIRVPAHQAALAKFDSLSERARREFSYYALIDFIRYGIDMHETFQRYNELGYYTDPIHNRAVTAYSLKNKWPSWDDSNRRILVTSYGIDEYAVRQRGELNLRSPDQLLQIPNGTEIAVPEDSRPDPFGFGYQTAYLRNYTSERFLFYPAGYGAWQRSLNNADEPGQRVYLLGIAPDGYKVYYITWYGEILSCCTQFSLFSEEFNFRRRVAQTFLNTDHKIELWNEFTEVLASKSVPLYPGVFNFDETNDFLISASAVRVLQIIAAKHNLSLSPEEAYQIILSGCLVEMKPMDAFAFAILRQHFHHVTNHASALDERMDAVESQIETEIDPGELIRVANAIVQTAAQNSNIQFTAGGERGTGMKPFEGSIPAKNIYQLLEYLETVGFIPRTAGAEPRLGRKVGFTIDILKRLKASKLILIQNLPGRPDEDIPYNMSLMPDFVPGSSLRLEVAPRTRLRPVLGGSGDTPDDSLSGDEILIRLAENAAEIGHEVLILARASANKLANLSKSQSEIAPRIRQVIDIISQSISPNAVTDKHLASQLESLMAEIASIEVAINDLYNKLQLDNSSKENLKDINISRTHFRHFRRMLEYLLYQELRLHTVDLNGVVRDAIDQVRLENRTEVNISFSPESNIEITADATRIYQMVRNLISNAVDAVLLKGEGATRVRSYTQGRYVVIEVSDGGIGIPPEIQQKMFDRGETTKWWGVHSGFGLSLVKEVVEQHGGTIEVESEAGKGTTFIIKLPLSHGADPSPTDSKPRAQADILFDAAGRIHPVLKEWFHGWDAQLEESRPSWQEIPGVPFSYNNAAPFIAYDPHKVEQSEVGRFFQRKHPPIVSQGNESFSASREDIRKGTFKTLEQKVEKESIMPDPNNPELVVVPNRWPHVPYSSMLVSRHWREQRLRAVDIRAQIEWAQRGAVTEFHRPWVILNHLHIHLFPKSVVPFDRFSYVPFDIPEGGQDGGSIGVLEDHPIPNITIASRDLRWLEAAAHAFTEYLGDEGKYFMNVGALNQNQLTVAVFFLCQPEKPSPGYNLNTAGLVRTTDDVDTVKLADYIDHAYLPGKRHMEVAREWWDQWRPKEEPQSDRGVQGTVLPVLGGFLGGWAAISFGLDINHGVLMAAIFALGGALIYSIMVLPPIQWAPAWLGWKEMRHNAVMPEPVNREAELADTLVKDMLELMKGNKPNARFNADVIIQALAGAPLSIHEPERKLDSGKLQQAIRERLEMQFNARVPRDRIADLAGQALAAALGEKTVIGIDAAQLDGPTLVGVFERYRKIAGQFAVSPNTTVEIFTPSGLDDGTRFAIAKLAGEAKIAIILTDDENLYREGRMDSNALNDRLSVSWKPFTRRIFLSSQEPQGDFLKKITFMKIQEFLNKIPIPLMELRQKMENLHRATEAIARMA